MLSAITAQVLQGLSYLHRHKHTVSPPAPPSAHQHTSCMHAGLLETCTVHESSWPGCHLQAHVPT